MNDFHVGQRVTFHGLEHRIYARGSTPGHFDLCLPDGRGRRWLNVPGTQLQRASVTARRGLVPLGALRRRTVSGASQATGQPASASGRLPAQPLPRVGAGFCASLGLGCDRCLQP